MIVSLHVKNYALIDELNLDLQSGFSVITGETGSGKSIILGALNLLLGHRNDSRSIKDSTAKCIVEAEFDISGYGLEQLFEQFDLDYEPHTIIRREITPSGKSRAFVNDSPVKLSDLQKLSSFLIDIHSQNENLQLDKSSFQLDVLDAFAGVVMDVRDYKILYQTYSSLIKQLVDEEGMLKRSKQEYDYYQFQFTQLDEADLKESEQEKLEKEKEMLENATDLKEGLVGLSQGIANESYGLLSLLQKLKSTANGIADYYEPAKEYANRLESAFLELQDLGEDAEQRCEGVEFDPQRLQAIEERLDLIYSLQQKHMVSSVEELITLKSEFESKIVSVEVSEEAVGTLKKKIEGLETKLHKGAELISEKRRSAIPELEQAIAEPLLKLGISYPQFKIEHEKQTVLAPDGIDRINYLFSANKNSIPRLIKEVASGGEKSRLMFSIKALLSRYKSLPTIIFDEIDTGISGEVANQMAAMLLELGKNMQVIVITHLPQVASKGNVHYKVLKFEEDDRIKTQIRPLLIDERIAEIAEMLSGKPPTEAALNNARELLKL